MNSRAHEDIPWFAFNEYRRQPMFVPRLNDAPVVIGDVGKRQEDRNNEKYGLDLQRHEITIIRECGTPTLTVKNK